MNGAVFFAGGKDATVTPHTTNSYRNLNVGFFDDERTERAVVDLAQADSITFFLGAGVSANQNVPPWADLVRHLLTSSLKGDISQQTLFDRGRLKTFPQAIIDSYFQLPMASAVDGLLLDAGHTDAVAQRNGMIRNLIYGDNDQRSFLQRPSLAREVVLTAIVLKASGQNVHILTTNYDAIIEEIAAQDEEVARLRNEWSLTFKSYTDSPGEIPDNEIPIVHIHGYIPRNGEPREVVFSEPDYVHWADRADLLRYVQRRFDTGHTVMLGASLRDHNIISYLKNTDLNARKKYALLPLQGDGAYDIGCKVGFDIISAIQGVRARALGIQALFPDFFGQVNQFLIELRTAAALRGDQSYAEVSYRRRIRQWESDLQSYSYGDDDTRRENTEKLRRISEEIGAILPEADHTKVELWARNTIDARTLELWCTSQSTYLGTGYWRHSKKIELASNSPAVLSFANRSVTLGRVVDRLDDRWTHYLTVPIILDEEPYGLIPVGSVVALFHAPDVQDARLPTDEVRTGRIRDLLLVCGTELLNPAD